MGLRKCLRFFPGGKIKSMRIEKRSITRWVRQPWKWYLLLRYKNGAHFLFDFPRETTNASSNCYKFHAPDFGRPNSRDRCCGRKYVVVNENMLLWTKIWRCPSYIISVSTGIPILYLYTPLKASTKASIFYNDRNTRSSGVLICPDLRVLHFLMAS